ncbi:hypothetical protein ACFSKY_21600 [Azotobacter chroococcum]|uniref:Ribbon-helix-helix protein, CopG family n=1 Tax=Azotobacter chroococcum TaxID=353 RepID=A0A4R1PPZ5_9GAMM|nr:hypothetical protein [Azotobacter chroococcum]TBV91734.1 hypothetical protein E0E53_19780 [Azotobacter chroococcum]TCL32896.1 hypothetical protein EV691_106156 [Azotobacter chroococcum]
MPQMTLTLSDEINDFLSSFARRNGITKAEAMRRALALLAIADREKQKGLSIGLVRENEEHELAAVGRVTGIFNEPR